MKVRITFDPEFADTVVEHIVSLPAHESWKKPDVQPSINTSYLCNLTEKIKATTTVQVLSKDGEVLAEAKKDLEVLDYCQYWGNTFMSQYLAAFVTPRHIALDPIIKRASELLDKWTGSSSLSAYTHDVPNRPKMIIGALYEAISKQNITYCYQYHNMLYCGLYDDNYVIVHKYLKRGVINLRNEIVQPIEYDHIFQYDPYVFRVRLGKNME